MVTLFPNQTKVWQIRRQEGVNRIAPLVTMFSHIFQCIEPLSGWTFWTWQRKNKVINKSDRVTGASAGFLFISNHGSASETKKFTNYARQKSTASLNTNRFCNVHQQHRMELLLHAFIQRNEPAHTTVSSWMMIRSGEIMIIGQHNTKWDWHCSFREKHKIIADWWLTLNWIICLKTGCTAEID